MGPWKTSRDESSRAINPGVRQWFLAAHKKPKETG